MSSFNVKSLCRCSERRVQQHSKAKFRTQHNDSSVQIAEPWHSITSCCINQSGTRIWQWDVDHVISGWSPKPTWLKSLISCSTLFFFFLFYFLLFLLICIKKIVKSFCNFFTFWLLGVTQDHKSSNWVTERQKCHWTVKLATLGESLNDIVRTDMETRLPMPEKPKLAMSFLT